MDDGDGPEGLCNEAQQYSVWPCDRPLPDGWRTVGVSGTRAQCLAHIDEVWRDLRPAQVPAPGAARDGRSSPANDPSATPANSPRHRA